MYHTLKSFVQVKLIGEGADDAGGVFDDTITEMCQELKTGVVNLILTTPNARNETGYNRDRYKIKNCYFISLFHFQAFFGLSQRHRLWNIYK